MQIRTVCIEALDYKTASVCIPPFYVKQVHEEFPTLNICTVIGFPSVMKSPVQKSSRLNRLSRTARMRSTWW